MGFCFSAILAADGSTTRQIYLALNSSGYAAFNLCVGLFLNAVGGYVAAATIGRRHLLFGGLAAVPCLILELFVVINPLPSYQPLWSVVSGWFLCIPFGVLGGYVASKRA